MIRVKMRKIDLSDKESLANSMQRLIYQIKNTSSFMSHMLGYLKRFVKAFF